MASGTEEALERAAARAERAREADLRRQQVYAENEAALQRELANTARLKRLRLAKEAVDREVALAAAAAKSVTAKSAAKKSTPRKRTAPSA